MFFTKIKEFAENFPESLEELNLRMIDFTNELVKLVTFIDFTDGNTARQDLFFVLQILEFCFLREKRERPEKCSSSAIDDRSKIFHSINLTLYRLSIQDVPKNALVETFLSIESIVKLCLLYVVDGALDDKNQEKLESVLRSECVNAKSCTLMVWSLLAILKKSVSLDVAYTVLPAWIPRSSVHIDTVFCDHNRIFEMLSNVASICSIYGTPVSEQFWEMVRDTSKMAYWETWHPLMNGRQKYITDDLVHLVKRPKFSMKYVDKLTEFAYQLIEMNVFENDSVLFDSPILEIENVNQVKENLIEFESRIEHLRENHLEIDESVQADLLANFLSLQKTVTFNDAKMELVNMMKFIFETPCKQTPQLEEIIKKNRCEINMLLSNYNDLGWLYSLVSPQTEMLSFDVHRKYNKNLLESVGSLKGWQLLAEYFKQLRWENRPEHVESYVSEARTLFRKLVVDSETRQKFLEFAEQNKAAIYQCFDHYDSLNDFLYSVFGLYPWFIPFESKVKNITRVIRYIEKKKHQNLLTECLEKFKNELGRDRKLKLSMAFLHILSVQNYSKEKICHITDRNASAISEMLSLVVTDHNAKVFYQTFNENQHLLNVDVVLLCVGRELTDLTESQQMILLSQILQKLEIFDLSIMNSEQYMMALEVLLPTALKTDNNVEDLKKKILQFVERNKMGCNAALLLDDRFSIFSRGALLSILKTNMTILNTDVKYKYRDILAGKDKNGFLWQIFGEYLKEFEIYQYEDLLVEISWKLKRKARYEATFVEQYKELVVKIIEALDGKSKLCSFLLSIPNLVSVETKHRLKKPSQICEQYDWLDECFIIYETVPITNQALSLIQDVFCSIHKDTNKTSCHVKMKAIIEKHISLITNAIIPKLDEKFELLAVFLWAYVPEKFPFHIKLTNIKTFSEIMTISHHYEWLDECLENYKMFSSTGQGLRAMDNVSALIDKTKYEVDHYERMETIIEKHIHLIVYEIIPQINANYNHLLTLVWSCMSEYFPFQVKLANIQKLLDLMTISQQYDWLDECFSEYKTLPNTRHVLRMIDNVCALINKNTIGVNRDEKMKTILEKHICLIVDEIVPANLKHLSALLGSYYPEMVPFEVKLDNMQNLLRERINGSLSITVDRNSLLENSYNFTSRLTAEQWRTKKFKIRFESEPGVDMGGLLRECFTTTTKEILNPNFALFVPTPGDANSYMINKSSHVNREHLSLFKFIGRFVAKSVVENIHLDCPLTKVLFKHIVGASVEYSDFESQDPEFFNSLCYILNNPISEAGLDLTFSTEIEHFGAFEEKELIENGKNIPVTDENKHEYVKLVSKMKMTESIRPQLNEFLAGFYDVIPKDLIATFNAKEMEMMLCGQSKIDIADLKANTLYSGYRESDDIIQWFWEALRSFGTKDKARFLMFTTSSPKAPLNGFAHLRGSNGIVKFNICKDLIIDRLPTAHTCFNRLDLPHYKKYDVLRSKLLVAIREGTEGFGMA